MTTETLVRQEISKLDETCSYDEVPYESLPFKHANPDRLAVMARLFGMNPTPINKCRVLEIGCASGGNLIPVAYSLPESEFLGIDLSSRQVNDGKAIVERLGLKNIEIRHQNVMDFPADAGEFDYIITHGVYSWIPLEAQHKIMEICQKHLSPQGVAYISYNTYPGWSFRGTIRQLMLYHARTESQPAQRLAKAKEIVDFVGRSVKQFSNSAAGPYAIRSFDLLLEEEAGFLKSQRPDYLLHEHLSDVNEPLYFWEFMDRAHSFGLQYLSESEYSTTKTTNFAKEVQDELAKYPNVLEVEQYMDFLRNRTFRQTLLCRQGVPITRDIPAERFSNLFIASPAAPTAEMINPQTNEAVAFSYNGSTLTTSNPLVKAAFLQLKEIWPRSIKFEDLVVSARSRVSPVTILDAATEQRGIQILANDLMLSYGINVVALRSGPDTFTTTISERPEASAVARNQSTASTRVTSQLHEITDLDTLASHTINLLDGTRDREAILDGLQECVAQDKLVVSKEGKRVSEKADAREVLSQHLDPTLQRLAGSCLLVN